MTQAQKIQSINDPGWDGLDADIEPLKINNFDAQTEIDLQYARCFNSDAGKKVLEHLRGMTIEQPAWMPGADVSYGYSREGQNSIVREIELRIRRVNELSS